MTHQILVVDDDPDALFIAAEALRANGMLVRTSTTPSEAHESIERHNPDLIVLDIAMGTDRTAGHKLCREIRAKSDVPIIFVTARATDIDAVVGLELGADEYVTKPFSPRELAARVRAVLRRFDRSVLPSRDAQMSIGKIVLDDAKLRVTAPAGFADLTRHEFFLLRTMASTPGKVFSRDELIKEVYEGEDVSPRTIDSHIRHLREKLRDLDQEPIETIRGVGYKVRDE